MNIYDNNVPRQIYLETRPLNLKILCDALLNSLSFIAPAEVTNRQRLLATWSLKLYFEQYAFIQEDNDFFQDVVVTKKDATYLTIIELLDALYKLYKIENLDHFPELPIYLTPLITLPITAEFFLKKNQSGMATLYLDQMIDTNPTEYIYLCKKYKIPIKPNLIIKDIIHPMIKLSLVLSLVKPELKLEALKELVRTGNLAATYEYLRQENTKMINAIRALHDIHQLSDHRFMYRGYFLRHLCQDTASHKFKYELLLHSGLQDFFDPNMPIAHGGKPFVRVPSSLGRHVITAPNFTVPTSPLPSSPLSPQDDL